MNYLSVCSGIEAATVAWHSLGWKPVAFSEIEKFPSEVLQHHYPKVPNVGDMTKFKEWNIGTIDLFVGGTPCQSFSVAGLRKGLDDPRGNLMLTYLAIAAKHQPTWIVWENVPGVLSSGGGEDFATFLRGLGECGYGFAYRVLDAQYFGVAQRRRRVFVIGCLGNWQRAAAVLFDASSLSGNPAPIRETRERTSTHTPTIAGTLCARDYKGVSTDDLDTKLISVYDHHPQDSRVREVDVSPTLNCRLGNLPIAHAFKVRGGCEGGGKGYLGSDETAFTLSTHQDQQIAVGIDTYNLKINNTSSQTLHGFGHIDHVGGIIQNMAVRRLTPIECERLQGFPDNYTNIKEKCPDGPRYKALGNSMAVPVMAWIGKRIEMVEELCQ
jgi:DNA (cytosine-5)-methyltransferase 1